MQRRSSFTPIWGDGSLDLALAVRDGLKTIMEESSSDATSGGDDEAQSCLVVFGDTFCSMPTENDSLLVAPLPDGDRWTTVLRDAEGALQFSDKSAPPNSGWAVVGQFLISDLARFYSHLTAAAKQAPKGALWRALQTYDVALGSAIKLVASESWNDVGHLDTFFDLRKAAIRGRSFNEFTYADGRGTVRKEGSDPVKISGEKRWIQELPAELGDLVPRLFASGSGEGGHPINYELEYVPAITVAEAWTCAALDLGYWTRVTRRIAEALGRMGSYGSGASAARGVQGLQYELFFGKVQSRVETLVSARPWSRQFLSGATVNGVTCMGVSEALALVQDVTFAVMDDTRWTIAHGDFFFGNMLYDRRADRLRLIDPRGAGEDLGTWGDPLYDLCKLSHSVRGEYDFLAADQFTIEVSQSNVFLETLHSQESRRIGDYLEKWLAFLLLESKVDEAALSILEGGLLMSVAPLHYENELRQQALLARGLQRISTAVG
jgi:hypothetical protein